MERLGLLPSPVRPLMQDLRYGKLLYQQLTERSIVCAIPNVLTEALFTNRKMRIWQLKEFYTGAYLIYRV